MEVEKSGADMASVVAFIKEHDGIVLKDWASNVTHCKVCKAVFPPSRRRARSTDDTSPFIKGVFDRFYPHVKIERCGRYYATVDLVNGKRFIVFDSSLESRLHSEEVTFRIASYWETKRVSNRQTFLGVEGILVSKE
jgi:hypothetical protein